MCSIEMKICTTTHNVIFIYQLVGYKSKLLEEALKAIDGSILLLTDRKEKTIDWETRSMGESKERSLSDHDWAEQLHWLKEIMQY